MPSSSDLELAIGYSKALEQRLERRCGAVGRGLHQKVDSVSAHLDARVVRELRLIATLRNKVVHEDKQLSATERTRLADAFETAASALDSTFRGPAVASARASGGVRSKHPPTRRSSRSLLALCDRVSRTLAPALGLLIGAGMYLLAACFRLPPLAGAGLALPGIYLGWRFHVHLGRVLLVAASVGLLWLGGVILSHFLLKA